LIDRLMQFFEEFKPEETPDSRLGREQHN